MKPPITRRTFLEQSGLATAGVAAGATLLNPQPVRAEAANDVVIGLVGCGGMGRADLRDFLKAPEVKVAALCDVDEARIGEAMQDVEKARAATGSQVEQVDHYKDFRELIDRKDIDVVIVGTPDQWHAYVATAACAAYKDVYCEKPVSHNVVEGRAMVDAARKYNRVMQIGTQQRSGSHFQSAVDLVRSGTLGKIHVCRTWITSNVSPDGLGNPADGDPPAGVDYDLWLGPAPERPFNVNRFHYQFRWFWDYGSGLTNDWGVHLNDLILWGMDRIAPNSVQVTGGRYALHDNTDTPDTLEIVYDFGDFLHVYSVRRVCQNAGMHRTGHGMQFEGTNGILTLDRGGWYVTPEGSKDEPRTPAAKSGGSDQHLPHVLNFLECVKTRNQPISDIEIAHRSTTTCHLANIAYKVGRKINWDAEREICVRDYGAPDNEANAHLFREPRAPWKLAT